MASVAPHDTVISRSASTSRPQATDCVRATALRSAATPHVVAYWLCPSRSAFAAASTIRGSVSKSGKPCAKLIARSGPLSSRFSRVISRMTDSVKLCAFSESRTPRSVSRIRALQVDVRARAREAALGALQPAFPPAAHIARPARLGEEVEHVRAAQEPDHLAALDDGDAPDPLAGEQPRGLVNPRVLGDRDDMRAHDVARDLALLGDDVDLRDDAHHHSLGPDHGRAGDAFRAQCLGHLLDRRFLTKGDHVARHHLFHRDHGVPSSLATVSKFALPPLSTRPLRPGGSLPARNAARGRAPVGSRASRNRVQAMRSPSAISSSVTVTTSSTSVLVIITSKLRRPIDVVRTPSASVAGDWARVCIEPAFIVR